MLGLVPVLVLVAVVVVLVVLVLVVIVIVVVVVQCSSGSGGGGGGGGCGGVLCVLFFAARHASVRNILASIPVCTPVCLYVSAAYCTLPRLLATLPDP